MFTPVTAEGILGEVLAKSYANTQDNNNRLPYNARPIVIVTADTEKRIENLVMGIFERLEYWNNGKEPLVASVIRSKPTSSGSGMCIYNNNTDGMEFRNVVALHQGDLKSCLEFRGCGLVFNIQEVRNKRLKDFLTTNLLEAGHFSSHDFEEIILSVLDNSNKGYRITKGIEKLANSIFEFFEEQATWLNPCVIFISSGMIEKTVSTELLAWKNRSNHTFRLFMMGRGLSYDLKTTFSEKNIDELAKAIVQYVEPKPIPRVKKKSVGDCLAIQLPVLEGALYDNN